jgi:hypothetical protein
MNAQQGLHYNDPATTGSNHFLELISGITIDGENYTSTLLEELL